jgi:hypothetical protein
MFGRLVGAEAQTPFCEVGGVSPALSTLSSTFF